MKKSLIIIIFLMILVVIGIGIASASVLTYYGKIVGTVNITCGCPYGNSTCVCLNGTTINNCSICLGR